MNERLVTLDAAIAELEAAEAAMRQTWLEKADRSILTRAGFDEVVAVLTALILEKIRPIDEAARRRMVRSLDRNWTKMSKAQQAEAIGRAVGHLVSTASAQAKAAGLVLAGEAKNVIQASRAETGRRYRAKTPSVFDAVDQRIVDHIKTSQAHYVRDEFGRRRESFSRKAREIVARGEARGLGSDEIGNELATTLNAAGLARSESYFSMVASVYTARARTYGTLRSFDEAGFVTFTFQAVLDEVTSVMCRFMHGKTFEVRQQLQRFAEVAKSGPESVVTLQPWMRLGKTEDGDEFLFVKRGERKTMVAKVEENAVGQRDQRGSFSKAIPDAELAKMGCVCPPLHGRCRSVLIPG